MFVGWMSFVLFSPQIGSGADDDAAKVESAAKDESKAESGVQATAVQGTPKIDGEIDDVWKTASVIDVKQSIDSMLTIEKDALATAKVSTLWDADHLYVLWQVSDPKLSASSSDVWAHDSVELFVDRNHEATEKYQSDDAQFRVNFESQVTGQGPGFDSVNVKAIAKKTDSGYVVEMSVSMEEAPLKAGDQLGIELQVNNDDGSGERVSVAKWSHPENDSWENTSRFGTLTLK